VRESKGGADFGAEQADELGLPEACEQRHKHAEGEKPPVLTNKTEVIHDGVYLARRRGQGK